MLSIKTLSMTIQGDTHKDALSNYAECHYGQCRGTKLVLIECRNQGILKGFNITVPLISCLTGLDKSVLEIKTKIVSCHAADSKPVK